jgi:hypothetical protein
MKDITRTDAGAAFKNDMRDENAVLAENNIWPDGAEWPNRA